MVRSSALEESVIMRIRGVGTLIVAASPIEQLFTGIAFGDLDGISVYVLRCNPAFSYRSSSVQPRYLHYRPDWPSASGWIAHRFLRPPLFGGVEAAVSPAMQVFVRRLGKTNF